MTTLFSEFPAIRLFDHRRLPYLIPGSTFETRCAEQPLATRSQSATQSTPQASRPAHAVLYGARNSAVLVCSIPVQL